MNHFLKFGIFSVLFLGITINGFSQKSAQDIIDKVIEVAGGKLYDSYNMEFDFRDKHYVSKRDNGVFEYSRIAKTDNEKVVITYGNTKPLNKTINGKNASVTTEMSSRIENSINSVNYFVLLPYGLNDKAVFKTYKGEISIKGKEYYMIQVTFSENGGGKDFEDVYMYWINKETFKIDYLAYSFLVNGGGIRFREAYNERYINGLRFVDYNNYKPQDKNIELTSLSSLFDNGELKLLSKIETKNIKFN
ncbi:DUF6503 family protein [Ichthyenterobacterium magnum]|uniref:Deoxyribose-phosphate aldolase n=1 Tax=Ichthyenterobacterium magnum TaxID=1230530 RepID=A0A420DLM9_9FLAO|nr:DUF6503 family protein [Ichthyenterobacterium magnum]RKE95108.1 hypothetical protein BXY80_1292 [Ichthyenterobacterium magnum]